MMFVEFTIMVRPGVSQTLGASRVFDSLSRSSICAIDWLEILLSLRSTVLVCCFVFMCISGVRVMHCICKTATMSAAYDDCGICYYG